MLDMERNAPTKTPSLLGAPVEVEMTPHTSIMSAICMDPPEHRHGLHVPQLREGKLDAEREEQEDDPELRQRLHLHELHDEPEAARPIERARRPRYPVISGWPIGRR